MSPYQCQRCNTILSEQASFTIPSEGKYGEIEVRNCTSCKASHLWQLPKITSRKENDSNSTLQL